MSRFVPNPDFDISHIVLVCDNSIYPEAILVLVNCLLLLTCFRCADIWYIYDLIFCRIVQGDSCHVFEVMAV